MSPKHFKEIREQLGLTQSQLAKLLGLSGKAPISHFEIGFALIGVIGGQILANCTIQFEFAVAIH